MAFLPCQGPSASVTRCAEHWSCAAAGNMRGLVRQLSIDQFENEGRRVSTGATEAGHRAARSPMLPRKDSSDIHKVRQDGVQGTAAAQLGCISYLHLRVAGVWVAVAEASPGDTGSTGRRLRPPPGACQASACCTAAYSTLQLRSTCSLRPHRFTNRTNGLCSTWQVLHAVVLQ